jgi:hypothetical protein
MCYIVWGGGWCEQPFRIALSIVKTHTHTENIAPDFFPFLQPKVKEPEGQNLDTAITIFIIFRDTIAGCGGCVEQVRPMKQNQVVNVSKVFFFKGTFTIIYNSHRRVKIGATCCRRHGIVGAHFPSQRIPLVQDLYLLLKPWPTGAPIVLAFSSMAVTPIEPADHSQ